MHSFRPEPPPPAGQPPRGYPTKAAKPRRDWKHRGVPRDGDWRKDGRVGIEPLYGDDFVADRIENA